MGIQRGRNRWIYLDKIDLPSCFLKLELNIFATSFDLICKCMSIFIIVSEVPKLLIGLLETSLETLWSIFLYWNKILFFVVGLNYVLVKLQILKK